MKKILQYSLYTLMACSFMETNATDANKAVTASSSARPTSVQPLEKLEKELPCVLKAYDALLNSSVDHPVTAENYATLYDFIMTVKNYSKKENEYVCGSTKQQLCDDFQQQLRAMEQQPQNEDERKRILLTVFLKWSGLSKETYDNCDKFDDFMMSFQDMIEAVQGISGSNGYYSYGLLQYTRAFPRGELENIEYYKYHLYAKIPSILQAYGTTMADTFPRAYVERRLDITECDEHAMRLLNDPDTLGLPGHFDIDLDKSAFTWFFTHLNLPDNCTLDMNIVRPTLATEDVLPIANDTLGECLSKAPIKSFRCPEMSLEELDFCAKYLPESIEELDLDISHHVSPEQRLDVLTKILERYPNLTKLSFSREKIQLDQRTVAYITLHPSLTKLRIGNEGYRVEDIRRAIEDIDDRSTGVIGDVLMVFREYRKIFKNPYVHVKSLIDTLAKIQEFRDDLHLVDTLAKIREFRDDLHPIDGVYDVLKQATSQFCERVEERYEHFAALVGRFDENTPQEQIIKANNEFEEFIKTAINIFCGSKMPIVNDTLGVRLSKTPIESLECWRVSLRELNFYAKYLPETIKKLDFSISHYVFPEQQFDVLTKILERCPNLTKLTFGRGTIKLDLRILAYITLHPSLTELEIGNVKYCVERIREVIEGIEDLPTDAIKNVLMAFRKYRTIFKNPYDHVELLIDTLAKIREFRDSLYPIDDIFHVLDQPTRQFRKRVEERYEDFEKLFESFDEDTPQEEIIKANKEFEEFIKTEINICGSKLPRSCETSTEAQRHICQVFGIDSLPLSLGNDASQSAPAEESSQQKVVEDEDMTESESKSSKKD